MRNWINRQWISIGGSQGVFIFAVVIVILGFAIGSLL